MHTRCEEQCASKSPTQRGIRASTVSTAGLPSHTAAEAAAALELDDVSRVVKSMVCVTSGGEPVVVLVGGDDRIDFTALAAHLGTPRVRLSTLAEAEEITGYEVGAVAPIGDFSLRTVMDAAVAASSSDVFTGAGNSDDHLQISPAELRRATGCSTMTPRRARSYARRPAAPTTTARPGSSVRRWRCEARAVCEACRPLASRYCTIA